MANTIITEKCKGCEKCVRNCPFDAIKMENKIAVVGDNCTNCGVCAENCPFDAIEKTETSMSNVDITLYHGVWVFAEQRDGALMGVSIELLGEGRKLATEIGCEMCAVLVGDNVDNLVDELFEYGADKVYYANAPELNSYTPDAYTKVIYKAVSYTHLDGYKRQA